MKMRIDKEVFTMAEKRIAENEKAEWAWVDKNDLVSAARHFLCGTENKTYQLAYIDKVLSYGDLSITKNHWRATLYICDMIVIGHDNDGNEKIVSISYDFRTYCEGNIEFFAIAYHHAGSNAVFH